MSGLEFSSFVFQQPATTLFVVSAPRNYRYTQHDELAADLARLDAGITLFPRPTLADLMLTPQGRTESSGFRYTWIGFSDICRHLSPGLAKCLPHIAGVTGEFAHDAELSDVQAAISMFNMALQLRYAKLRDKQLIVNAEDGTIDGLVGTNHCLLANSTLLAIADAAASSSTPGEQFYAATTVGRRLVLYYREVAPAFRVTHRDRAGKFWLGHYLCNGEAGRMSLRGASALYGQVGLSIGGFSAASVLYHAGSQLEQQATRLLSRLFAAKTLLQPCQHGLARLAELNLRLCGPERDLQLARLRRALVRRHLSLRLVNDVLDRTIRQGADKHPIDLARMDPIDGLGEAARLRTGFDLYCALLRCSRQLSDPRRRERLAQAAHDLMLDKFRLF